MLKKSITYKDLDNETVTEDFYFHLSKAEIAELEVDAPGGSFQKMFEDIIARNDKSMILKTFKLVLHKAYGIREEGNNRRFRKSDEISEEFLQTDAYSELFTELMTNPESAAQFILAVIPEIPAAAEARAAKILDVEVTKPFVPPASGVVANPDPVTPDKKMLELNNMSAEDLRTLLAEYRNEAQ
jgi:hypothetical protein